MYNCSYVFVVFNLLRHHIHVYNMVDEIRAVFFPFQTIFAFAVSINGSFGSECRSL